MQSEHIEELATALAKAQGQIKNAVKDSVNPVFKSRYADLASVWDACREPLSSHGLAVVQTTEEVEDCSSVLVVTTLLHASGQWISGRLRMRPNPNKNDPQGISPQGIGSALTYARRYALSAIVGLAPDDDDDANAASTPAPQPRAQVQPNNGELLATLFSLAKQAGITNKLELWQQLGEVGIIPEDRPVDFKVTTDQLQGAISWFREGLETP